jgi:hypothetical protein
MFGEEHKFRPPFYAVSALVVPSTFQYLVLKHIHPDFCTSSRSNSQPYKAVDKITVFLLLSLLYEMGR